MATKLEADNVLEQVAADIQAKIDAMSGTEKFDEQSCDALYKARIVVFDARAAYWTRTDKRNLGRL